MNKKKVLLGFILILVCLITFSIPTLNSSAQNAEPLSTATPDQETTDQIEQAILATIAVSDQYQQGKMVTQLKVSDVKISKDLQWATAWVVYYDIQTEALLPTEPGLVVTRFMENNWQVYLPTSGGWQNAITSLPEDLLSGDEKNMWLSTIQGEGETAPTQTGYYLPWHGGETANLSRSVGHDADYSTAHYAFDFYVPGSTVCPGDRAANSGTEGLNFNLYASKAATVWGWDDSVENCDHSAVNFIVLRNIDDPTIFQLYLHLSQGSIPTALKSVGVQVARGQFIAIADNTGASSGSHLHFQVQRQPTWPPANPYWATALDVTFEDVAINGGRPRSSPLDPPYCRDDDICDVFTSTYTSGNYYMGDSIPPTGGLSGVTNGEVINNQTITLSGWGTDNQSGLHSGQLKAYFDDTWHNIGPEFNPDFTYTWNLCEPGSKVDNGAVSVALLLYDNAGNVAPVVGLTHFIKDYSCPIPPPTCIPDANQVTLFEDPYFNGGCVKFTIGDYPDGDSLSPLGNNDGDSILVGENVIATLYSETNYLGHSQSVLTDIGFIKYQWVGQNVLSSMKITSRESSPLSPSLNLMTANVYREGDVIPLSWLNGGGAVDFQIQVFKNENLYLTIPWQTETVKYVDSLPQGDYKWRVQARNPHGLSGWSSYLYFTIVSPIQPPDVKTVPYSDTMETSQAYWARDGLWTYINNSLKAHSGTHSWWYQNSYGNYDNDLPNSGSLTSPPFSIPSAGYYMRFYYQYQSETDGNTWDQRLIQISVDGSPFVFLAQFSQDPQVPETNSWLRNKALDLSPYAGHVVQLRFVFTTWDAIANNYSGWGIDDFSISATAPITCDDTRQDDTPAQAFLLTYDTNITLPGQICPNGDWDYYKFYGEAGDRIVADIDAMINGSLLDTYLYLLDSDGQTIIAENDDEVYAELRDSLLAFTLPHDGLFYLKLRAWKHPLVGGQNYYYTLRLFEDHVQPQASITWPVSNSFLPDSIMTVIANIADTTNTMNRVEFYWHSPNWIPGEWVLLSIDRNGQDGWNGEFDPAAEPEGYNAAFFIKAYDMAGNLASAGAWNLGIDKTAPITEMDPLEAIQGSNAFLLEWTATDNLSGIDYLEVQERINNGGWITQPPLTGTTSMLWIIGTPGNAYAYRMHGVDLSGNAEPYPENAEAITTIPTADVLCENRDSYDNSGNNDNSPANANLIIVNEDRQVHNYCNPLSADYQNDEDWVKFSAEQGKLYFIRSHANSIPTATTLSLFAEDGSTLISESIPDRFGESTYLFWTPDYDQTVYLRLKHLDGRVIGSVVSNIVTVTSGPWNFLPFINK